MYRMEYEERQRFGVWAFVICIGAGLAAVLVPVLIATGFAEPGEDPLPGWFYALTVLPLLVIPNVFFMTTRVADGVLYVRFGLVVPFYWKRFPLRDIATARAVTYRPLRDAGGWGIRWGRFEGAACHYLNARGDRGVLIEASGRRYIIGSQSPERLQSAIASAIGGE